AGLVRQLYRHKIPGFNIGVPLPLPRFGEGGPSLMRNRAFFFFSFEKPHTITPTDPVTVTVPTALERQGNFSLSKNSSGATPSVIDPLTGLQFPGNIIPPAARPGCGVTISRINPSQANLSDHIPLQNHPPAA